MTSSLDQAQVLNAAMDRKAKQFDKVIGEWKGKVDRLSFDLDVSQKETRNASSELFKVKSAYEETMLQLEEVRRENKTLSNEIKDIMDQISEGGRSIHEIDKIRKRLEAEKMELQSALEEAEATLEQEENKVLRCQLELNAVRQEIERRLAEKEEEFILVKKAQSKALDSMQVALETETKSKAEALRMKKSPPPSLPLPTPRSPPTAGPLLLPTVLRRLVLFLRLPTASAVLLSRSLLTPTRLWLTSPTSTSPSVPPRGS